MVCFIVTVKNKMQMNSRSMPVPKAVRSWNGFIIGQDPSVEVRRASFPQMILLARAQGRIGDR